MRSAILLIMVSISMAQDAVLPPVAPFTGKSRAGVYGDFVAQVDWTIGQVLDTLDRLGMTDNTLVIVTSDNGSHEDHIDATPILQQRRLIIICGKHRDLVAAILHGQKRLNVDLLSAAHLDSQEGT